MLDDLNAREGRDEAGRSRAPRTPDPAQGTNPAPSADRRPLVDREVPIELTGAPDMVHSWLDGELPQSALRGLETARHVEFWNRLDRDLEARRHVRAPLGFADRVMEALPTTVPRLETPWWTRSVSMNPVAVAAAAAGLLALGTAIGATMRVK
jgi:hypothetical protein